MEAKSKIDKATGAVIRRLRKRARVSQQNLAGYVGVSYQQMQKYECGFNRLSIPRLFAIAEALGTKPDIIIRLIEAEMDDQKALYL